MNIGNIKGMLGDAVSNDVRTLELKIGQVVRGVVLQQYDNNEALVNINGVQVRAKLEIPLMEGQAALMQVQPDSKGSYILLRQMDPTSLGMNDPMKDILKAMSLPDKAWANEIIKDLRREGFPLNKETAAAFQKAAQLMPQGANAEQWMQAAASAFKRGLPMTQATISAIHQLQSGTPMHGLIDQLKGQLTSLLQNNGGQAVSPQTTALLNHLSSLLEEGSALLRSLASNGATTQAVATGSTAAQGYIQGGVNGTVAGSDVQIQVQQSHTQAAGQSQNSSSQTAAQNNLGNLMKWLGVNHESSLGRQLLSQPTAGSQANQAAGQTTPIAQGNIANTAPSVQGNGLVTNPPPATAQVANPLTAGQQPVAGSPAPMPINNATSTQSQQPQAGALSNQTQVTQQTAAQAGSSQQPVAGGALEVTTGTGGGQQAVNQTNQQTTQPLAQPAQQVPQSQAVNLQSAMFAGNQPDIANPQTALQHNPFVIGQQGDSAQPQAQPTVAHANQVAMNHDSLKSTIMQLVQSADTPAGVKETAQQLLSAITGQQLMLSTERNHSVFSHVTMYIPLQDKDGGQTAAVHIQTRRDRKGELDSENCRIVFDLNMNAIGPTMVDVNITNKIVSLNLWNDHPIIGSVIDAMKPEISEALYSTGYMLSSVRTTPIPLPDADNEQLEELKQRMLPPDLEQINSTRYKGVDFKV